MSLWPGGACTKFPLAAKQLERKESVVGPANLLPAWSFFNSNQIGHPPSHTVVAAAAKKTKEGTNRQAGGWTPRDRRLNFHRTYARRTHAYASWPPPPPPHVRVRTDAPPGSIIIGSSFLPCFL